MNISYAQLINSYAHFMNIGFSLINQSKNTLMNIIDINNNNIYNKKRKKVLV